MWENNHQSDTNLKTGPAVSKEEELYSVSWIYFYTLHTYILLKFQNLSLIAIFFLLVVIKK